MVCGSDVGDKRVSDKDFTTKRYFYADIDIRMDIRASENRIIDDAELNTRIENIMKVIDEFSTDYSAIIATGNGLHVYYVWAEQSFTKEEYTNCANIFFDCLDWTLSQTWHKCDRACSNIARLSRLPWSINTRVKNTTRDGADTLLFDMWSVEAVFLFYEKRECQLFNDIKSYLSEEDDNIDTMIQDMVVKNVNNNSSLYTSEDNFISSIKDEVNRLDLLPIAMNHLWLGRGRERNDIIPLITWDWKKRNCWVYYHISSNKIVSTGTHRLKHIEPHKWTNTWWFVRYEMFNGDKERAKQYFKEVHNISFSPKKEDIIKDIVSIGKPKEDIIYWFDYPWDVFWPFDCLRSWEFCMIASKTNAGKSTFANKIAQVNAKQYKVAYINLEFPINDMLEISYKRAIWCDDFNIKSKWTTRLPYSEEEKAWLQKYIDKCRSTVDYFDMKQWSTIKDVVMKIKELNEQRYRLIVVDSFSSIADAKDKLETQNEIIETFHEVVKVMNICLIWVHHFNKSWKDYAGSQKIEDLSQVFIGILPNRSESGVWYREFILRKDKNFGDVKTIKTVMINWEYDIYM